MPDVFAVCDRVVVLRRGSKVADKPIADELARRSHRPDHRRDPRRLRTPCRRRSAKPPHAGNVAIEDRSLGIQRARPLAALRRAQAFWVTIALIVICVVMSWLQPASFATRRQFLQHHPQLRLHRHHGARHDRGDHHRRHRPSVGSIMGLVGVVARPDAARPASPGALAIVAGLAAGVVAGARQRRADRLCRPVALRGDARHAVDRALARGGAVAEQDDLRFRPRRRPTFKRIGGGAILGIANPVWVLLAPDRWSSRVVLQLDELGPPSLRDRRQRAGGAADRRAGRRGSSCRPISSPA